MDFALPESLTDYLAELDAFIEAEIIPLEQTDDNICFFDHRREDSRTDWERGGLPNKEWEALLGEARRRADAAGHFRYPFPTEFGGRDGSNLAMAIIREHLASKGLGLHCDLQNEHAIVGNNIGLLLMLEYGTPEQREEWVEGLAAGTKFFAFGITEPDHGSDPANMSTRAKRDGSDWVINGAKMWITNGPIADVAVVWANTEEEGVLGFVVPTDTPGFTANEIKHKASLRMSKTGELVFDNVRLPQDAVLPNVRGLKGPLSCLSEARFGIVFGAVGAARDCLETTLEYVGTREVFDKPLSGYQLTQAKIADMAVELGKAQLLALHLGRLKDDGRIRPEQVSVGKLNNVREALKIARQCRTLLGANGVTLEYPVLRHANNLESVLTYEGTSEVHQLMIGQALTGQSAFR